MGLVGCLYTMTDFLHVVSIDIECAEPDEILHALQRLKLHLLPKINVSVIISRMCRVVSGSGIELKIHSGLLYSCF